MYNEFDNVQDFREREKEGLGEEAQARAEQLRAQSSDLETLGGKDHCKKKKPDPGHKDLDRQFVFLVFLILILLILSLSDY